MSHRPAGPLLPPSNIQELRLQVWKARVLSMNRPRPDTALFMMLGVAVDARPEWTHGLSPTWPHACLDVTPLWLAITLEAGRPSSLRSSAPHIYGSIFTLLSQHGLLRFARSSESHTPAGCVFKVKEYSELLVLGYPLRPDWRERVLV
jgi:hypothetical protein